MNRPFRKICIVVLVMICQTTFSQKIGLLLDDFISDRWYLDKKHFTERVTELGGEVLFEVAYADTGAQVSLAKKMLNAGVKVLVIVPTDARQARKIAELASQKGVPLISYDRLILSNKVSLYISYDNQKVGRLQAQYALKQKPEGKYIQINGPVSDNNAVLFKAGQDEALSKATKQGKVQILGSFEMEDWGELGAWMKLEEFLSKGGLVPDAVLTANDALAAGVIRALSQDLQGKVIVTGQDADISGLKNIFSGTQSMTVYKPIAPLAKKAAELAIDLANGKEISGTTNFLMGALSVKAILLDPLVVDKSNYKETVVKDGHATLEEIEN
jgi:D-xylose transport system substrate-binding protein